MNFGYLKDDDTFSFFYSPLSKHRSTRLQADYLAVFAVLSSVGRDKSQQIKQNFVHQDGSYFGMICHSQDILSHC